MEKEQYIPGYVQRREYLFYWANILALITIFYNMAEGLVSVLFGLVDGTVALLGFGIDSFVEVISGVGIWHMIQRLKEKGFADPDQFESQALKITGMAFYILAGGLIVTAVVNLVRGYKPETTFWGIVISLISIATMWALAHYKVKVGTKLNSDAILADANCTKACLYLSVVLLVSSIGYALTGFGWFDSLGAGGIAVFSYREGREAFQKAKGKACGCGGVTCD